MKFFEINVNNKIRKVEADPSTPLLWILRDNLNLVGTKYGCGISQCGACTIHLNGEAIRSCVYPISAVGKQKITTIEGLDTSIDLKKLVKYIKKKFNCNGSIFKTEESNSTFNNESV